MDRNINYINENLCPVNIYLDLSKAFGNLIYDILLSKLIYYGLQSNALQLIKSYISGRCQYVQLGDVKSSTHAVVCGIPQGSVLSPLLFNIYINNSTKATSKFIIIMYADNTALVSTLKKFWCLNNIAVIEDKINSEISKTFHWLHSNKLLLNTAKSNFMVFFKHPETISKLKLTINDSSMKQVTEINFLGITIDQNVTWSAYITKTFIKIAR